MRTIRIEPKKLSATYEVENSLSELQKEVGGTIQVVYPFDDPVGIVCNDEGKLIGLPSNRALRHKGQVYDVLNGNALIVGLSDDGDFTDLADDLAEKYLDMFRYPEIVRNKDILSLKSVVETRNAFLSALKVAVRMPLKDKVIKMATQHKGIEQYLMVGDPFFIPVDEELLSLSGVSYAEAWSAAKENTFKDGEMHVINLSATLSGESDEDTYTPAYFLTNNEMIGSCYGASQLLDAQRIKEYFIPRKKEYTKVFIVPLSVHECLCYPVMRDASISEFEAEFADWIAGSRELISAEDRLVASCIEVDLTA